MQDILNISCRTFCIVKHTFLTCIYLLWFFLIYTVVQFLIYFDWYVRTSFRIFHVPVNLLIGSVWFRKICNEVTLQSTSEARIWFPTVIFSRLIIIVALIEGWFLIALILSLVVKSFFSCLWPSTVTAPPLRNIPLSVFLTELSKF